MGVEVLITAATRLPVDLNDFKEHLRVYHSDEDETLNAYLKAATSWAETFTRRAFISQTWELQLDDFPHQMEHPQIVLPRGKLQSITSVKYKDLSDVEQTLAVSVYQADTDIDPGRLLLAYDQDWPDVLDFPRTVKIRYVCGYGDTPDTVPEEIQQAVKIYGAHLDDNREAFVTGTIVSKIPLSAENLLQPYRLLHL